MKDPTDQRSPSEPRLKRLVKAAREARERHKDRHRPSGFGFAIADRIAYVDAAVWDRLTARASIFLRRPYLGALEAAGPENMRGRYAVIFDGSAPVAAVAAQIVELSASRLALQKKAPDLSSIADPFERAVRKVAGKVARKVRSTALEGIEAKVLVCGNPLSWGQHGVAFAADVDPKRVWPGVAEALYRIRRAEKLEGQADFVVVKDLPAGDAGAEALRTFSFRPVETDPDMVLEIHRSWKRYEDYLASLQSKYRRTAVKIDSDFAEAGFRLAPLSGLSKHSAKLHELYLQVHGEARVRLTTLRPELLPALETACGADFRCTGAFRGEELVGFITTLHDGETAVGYYIGFDRAANAEAPIYFRLLQAVIGDAIELGCSRLSFGRTALEPKARLGAKPVPLAVWIRHRVPAMNWVLRRLLRSVHHDEAPERNPFKA